MPPLLPPQRRKLEHPSPQTHGGHIFPRDPTAVSYIAGFCTIPFHRLQDRGGRRGEIGFKPPKHRVSNNLLASPANTNPRSPLSLLIVQSFNPQIKSERVHVVVRVRPMPEKGERWKIPSNRASVRNSTNINCLRILQFRTVPSRSTEAAPLV